MTLGTADRDEEFLPDDPGRGGRAGGPVTWRILLLLFAANLVNFYDRAAPSIVVEPLKAEFGLTDGDVGVLSSAFTLVYAVVGIPLGILADRASRKQIMGWGLAVWSALTAATAAAGGFGSLLLVRLGVGVGEASFAPAANSMIADLHPAGRRAKAVGIVQLGLPLGLVAAYLSVGQIAAAFGSWRAPFLVAAVPGLVLALCFFFVREPRRGGAEGRVLDAAAAAAPITRPIRRILSVPTIWWLVIGGIGTNMASYSVNTFSVALFQRYFGVPLTTAAGYTGVVVGVTGLVGLLAGGMVADRAGRRSPAARVLVGAIALVVSAPLTFVALQFGREAVLGYVVLFGVGWLLQYVFYPVAYPAVADVVAPRLRGTAMAVFFGVNYVLGGALGPVITGALSDSFARAAGGPPARAAAEGLHSAFLAVVPAALLLAAVGLFAAARSVRRDAERMPQQLTSA